MHPNLLVHFDATLVAIAAAIVDVRQHRIPNAITYPAIGLGMVIRCSLYGWRGLASAIAGAMVATGIMFLFYCVKAMGAGDVKLMAAIGSLVGLTELGTVLAATAIAGGVMATIYVCYRGRFGSTLRSVASVVLFHSESGLRPHPRVNLNNPAALRMPYGLAIAAGSLYALLAAMMGGGL